jgi:hypothetical protein
LNAVFFSLYIILILLIIEISTVLLQATGLRREVARFQAISLLTGTGYTTSESEMIINHPLRRRIASFLIIFGTISFAVILSFVISFFVSNVVHLSDLGIGLAVLVFALFLLRSPLLRRKLAKSVETQYERYHVHHKSIEEVFHVDSDYVMRQFLVTEAHIEIVNIALKELNLAQQDVKIMNIKRNNHIIKNPTGSTMIQPGDQVLVYGDAENIRKFFILSKGKTTKET